MADRRRMLNDNIKLAKKNSILNADKKSMGTDEKGEYLNLLFDFRSGHLVDKTKLERFKHLQLKYGK